MTPWLVEFPQARHAPDDVRRALRALDPTAEVVYMGDGRWIVGRVRPNALVRQQMLRLLDKTTATLALGKQLSARGRGKILLALLGLQGFRPVAEYHAPDLDGSVVEDFRVSQWMLQHRTDNEDWRELDAAMDAPQEAAMAQLRDEGLAREAWRTAFTLNFGRASQRPTETPRATGRTRHLTLT